MVAELEHRLSSGGGTQCLFYLPPIDFWGVEPKIKKTNVELEKNKYYILGNPKTAITQHYGGVLRFFLAERRWNLENKHRWGATDGGRSTQFFGYLRKFKKTTCLSRWV